MSNNCSHCKCLGVLLGLLLGTGAALLAGFNLMLQASLIAAPILVIFSALVLLSVFLLFALTGCGCACKKLHQALCRDGRYIAFSAIGAILAGVFALGFTSIIPLLSLLFALFYGIAIFFFTMMLVGLYCLMKSSCLSACPCNNCNCSCNCD